MSLEDLTILEDLTRWTAAGHKEQDKAIAEARALLGAAWRHRKTALWTCRCYEPAQDGDTARRYRVLGHRLATFVHGASGIEMVLLPGLPDTLAPFLIARWPVTRERWGLPKTGSWKDRLPLTIDDLAAIEARLRAWGLRLPTRIEWRHAAQSGSPYEFPWGERLDLDACWFAENASDPELAKTLGYRRAGPDFTLAVSGLAPPLSRPQLQPLCFHEEAERWNAFGLVDIFGNLWELLAPRSKEGRERLILDAAGGSFAEIGGQDPPILIKDLTWPTERAVGLRPAASLEERSEMALGLTL